MALRDQPYLPLYIQDFLTDEKLNECSASTVGVYIKIMCLMHKSEEYGTILLKQKDKQSKEQNFKQSVLFSLKLAKLLPFDFDVIQSSLEELLDEKVLHIEGDFLCQKRMIKDHLISIKRSLSGKSGGLKSQQNRKEMSLQFAKANFEANSEYEYENDIIVNNQEKKSEMISLEKKTFSVKITGVGEVEVYMVMSGIDWWLSEIEKFITQSEDRFVHLAMQKPLMQKPTNFQKILQAFINHHQSSADEQTANRIRNHFKNWIEKQNGSLEKLVLEDVKVKSQHAVKLDSVESVKQFVAQSSNVGQGTSKEDRIRLQEQARKLKEQKKNV